MKRPKRLYYIPGILTLIFLPILITNKVSKESENRKEYCIPLIIFDTSQVKHFNYPIPAKRDYIKINISGIASEDNMKYNQIRNFARGIDQSKDSSIGIKIIFGRNIKYYSYIAALNELIKAKVQTYVPFGDTIFVYYMKRTDCCKESNMPDNWSCNEWRYYSFWDDCRTEEERQKELWIQRKKEFIMHLHYWPIYLAYFVLVFLAIRAIIRGKN